MVRSQTYLVLCCWILACCAQERAPHYSLAYGAPQVELSQVSANGCLNLGLLHQQLSGMDPAQKAYTYTYDISVQPSVESCPGAVARLVKGNFRRREQAPSEIFGLVESIVQTDCKTVEVVDADHRSHRYRIVAKSSSELQINDAANFGFGVRWLSPEKVIVRRRFPALNLRRPRLSDLKFNPQRVEVTEIVQWDESAASPRNGYRVSSKPLKVLLEATEDFPMELATELVQIEPTELILSAEKYDQIQNQRLRPDLDVCEPYLDKCTQVERSPDI